MGQPADNVAAAEAVRTWVLAQRATWAGDTPLPAVPFDSLPLPVTVTPPSGAAFPPDDIAMEEPVEAPAAPSLAPFLRIQEPITSVYVEAPRRLFSGPLMTRAAVVLAACGVVGSGGFVAWKRYAAVPRIGTAVIASSPNGAEVLVDGTPAGATPLRLDLPTGRHQLELRLKGQTRTAQITIARGAETPISIDWNARQAGVLQIASTPVGARVLVDGRERGITPLDLTDVPAGSHVVQIESPEGSVRRTVQVGAGRTEVITESIYPGWIHVSAPFDVALADGKKGVQLDSSNRALMKPGPHTVRIESRALGFVETRQIIVEPGGTTELDIASPTSTLTVSGPAGAEVRVDGERVGEVPLAAYPVKLGTRDVTIVEPSGVSHHRSLMITSRPATIEITAGQP
jgi:hypothetical protein